MPNRFNAREILAELHRNRRFKRVPFTPIQCFGLTFNEQRSDASRFDFTQERKETRHG